MTDWTNPVTRVLRTGRSRRPRGRSASSATRSSTSGVGRRPSAEPRRRRPRAARGMPVKSSVPSRKRATATSSAAMRAADARGPEPARLAGDPQRREARLVGRAEVEPAGGDEVGRRGRRRAAVGVGQGVLDGKSHVGGAQLGLEGAVDEPDGGVDDALRVDDDLDRVVADIVQPVCLDDLQALVGERRRVDRDLGAHRPGRVAEGLRRGRRRRARPAVASRNGPPEAVRIERGDAGHRLADEALPDRRVLGVDRPEPGERAGERVARVGAAATPAASARASGITRWPPATSVSLLAVATTLPARSAARTGRRLTTPPVPTTTRSTSSRVASASRASGAADAFRAGRQVEPGQRPARRRAATAAGRRRAACSASRPAFEPAASATTRNASGCAARTSTAWRPIEPVEPSSATRAAGGPRPAPAQRRRARTYRVTTGAANRNESTRSSMPPWPGMSVARVLGAGGPLEHRLGEVAGLRGQRRSAARAASAWSRVCAEAPEHERRRRSWPRRPRRPAPRSSSTARCGSGTCVRPKFWPTRYAPVSYDQTARISSRIQPRSRTERAERRVAPGSPARRARGG